MKARRMLIMSITTEKKQPMTMKNPPHPGAIVWQECIEPIGSSALARSYPGMLTRS